MNTSQVDQVARAVLYEGYLLYPYRLSSTKNRQRWTFGGLVPQAHSLATGETEPWAMQTECLVHGSSTARLRIQVRFLHLLQRTAIDGSSFVDRQEAVEREVVAPAVALGELWSASSCLPFAFSGRKETALIGEATVEDSQEAVEGTVQVGAERLEDDLFRIRVRVENRTPSDDAATRLHDFASTHAILHLDGPARFLSLIDPPTEHRAASTACRNVGCWPVLAGEPGEQQVVLASPIILYDYPQVAPESPGDLFDGTEIDEILTLRVLTLTDAERAEIRSGDERGRHLLERTEALGTNQLLALHGALRNPRAGRGEPS
jgi:hypothetical protein